MEELRPANAALRARTLTVLDAVEDSRFWRVVEVVLKDLKSITVRRIFGRPINILNSWALLSTMGALCKLVHESREVLEGLGPACASARATTLKVRESVENPGFWREVEVVLKDLKPTTVHRIVGH
jgi:hypothetical protein